MTTPKKVPERCEGALLERGEFFAVGEPERTSIMGESERSLIGSERELRSESLFGDRGRRGFANR